MTVTNTAVDPDAGDVLSYSLPTAPSGAQISSNGIITWLATPPLGPNLFQTVVTDNGSPPSAPRILSP